MRPTISNITISMAFFSIACAINARIQEVNDILEEHGVPQDLGIEFKYEAVLDIDFKATSIVSPGMSLFKDDVVDAPTFHLTFTQVESVSHSKSNVETQQFGPFVLSTIELDASNQVVRFLAVNYFVETVSPFTKLVTKKSPISQWTIPEVKGAEAHRVVFVVFRQPGKQEIQAPSGHFNIKEFAQTNDFKDPIAANLILVKA